MSYTVVEHTKYTMGNRKQCKNKEIGRVTFVKVPGLPLSHKVGELVSRSFVKCSEEVPVSVWVPYFLLPYLCRLQSLNKTSGKIKLIYKQNSLQLLLSIS